MKQIQVEISHKNADLKRVFNNPKNGEIEKWCKLVYVSLANDKKQTRNFKIKIVCL